MPDVATAKPAPSSGAALPPGESLPSGTGLPPSAGLPTGAALAGELEAAVLGELDEYGLIELMRAARRLTAWADSMELTAMAELDRRREAQARRGGMGSVAAARALADEVSAALTLSGTAASIRLGLAIALDRLLTDTARALRYGLIDLLKAKVICDGVIGASAAVARRVEREVLPEAPSLTARQLAARVRQALIAADPDAAERRRKTAEKERRVELYDNLDGTSDLAARDLPADAAGSAFNYLNALAKGIKTGGDDRPIAAIRADVMLGLLRGRTPAELGSAQHRPEPAAPPAASGTGEPGQPGKTSGPDEPGDTARAEAAAMTGAAREELTRLLDQLRYLGRPDEHRALVAEAACRMRDAVSALKVRWCATSAGDQSPVFHGGTASHGSGGYRPPAAMRRTVVARDGTCRFPSCGRNAAQCDLDHTLAHHLGGPTCPCNLSGLCRRHHRLKQTDGWDLVQLWPGVLLWITPTGHWHLVGPDPR